MDNFKDYYKLCKIENSRLKIKHIANYIDRQILNVSISHNDVNLVFHPIKKIFVIKESIIGGDSEDNNILMVF